MPAFVVRLSATQAAEIEDTSIYTMMSGFQKIKVENPVVEMDGDEMTRYMREPIFSSLIQNTK